MRIGLDFDNTIVCYDQAIAQLAEELLDVPKSLPRTKLSLRDFLRSAGRETDWTDFQGELYGPGMRFAKPFFGAISTMQHLVEHGHELVIVSHRSRRPYSGKSHDLHKYARDWLKKHLHCAGLFSGKDSIVEYHDTQERKIARIYDLGCQVFIDDLPEVLEAIGFKEQNKRILFDPSGTKSVPMGCCRVTTWRDLKKIL